MTLRNAIKLLSLCLCLCLGVTNAVKGGTNLRRRGQGLPTGFAFSKGAPKKTARQGELEHAQDEPMEDTVNESEVGAAAGRGGSGTQKTTSSGSQKGTNSAPKERQQGGGRLPKEASGMNQSAKKTARDGSTGEMQGGEMKEGGDVQEPTFDSEDMYLVSDSEEPASDVTLAPASTKDLAQDDFSPLAGT
jgi:hypothetical protein